jgi:hypothetical protein
MLAMMRLMLAVMRFTLAVMRVCGATSGGEPPRRWRTIANARSQISY